MSEDFRRLPRTFEEDPTMFRWYTNEFKHNLGDKLDISEIIDIFTCDDTIPRLYQFVTTQYTTDFYIIKESMTLREHIPVLHNNIFQSMLRPIQTGNVWWVNTSTQCSMTKYFTVWPLCLVLFDRVRQNLGVRKYSIKQLKSFLWFWCLMSDILFVWTAVSRACASRLLSGLYS